MIRRLLIPAALMAVGAALSGCVIYSGSEGENVEVRVGDHSTVAETAPAGEALRAARFDGAALVVRVDSNGCTQASDFSVSVTDGDPASIRLVRDTPDLCKALVPDGVELRWTYDELGLQAGTAARIENALKL
jgi:hypothetical protein